MPLSPEDQRRYDAIKALNQRRAGNEFAPTSPPAPEQWASPPPQPDMSDAARMDRLRQTTERIARNNLIDAALPPSTPRPPYAGDPLAYLRSPAETALRQSGGTLVDNLPMGVDPGQRVVAQPSRLVGGGIQDGIPRPTFQTDYGGYGADGRQGSMTITGPDQRRGGGTLSAPDQGNGGTVEGNVAALNRQTEALRSLREAQNPGITTGNAGRAFGDTVSFGTPGGGYGQEQLDANRALSLRDLPFGQPGDGRKRKDLLNLMELQQRGQQFDAQQRGEQEKVAMQQQAGILRGAQEAQTAAANRQWEQAKWGQQFGLDQQRVGLAQQQAATEQQSKQTGILKDLAGLDQERMKQALFGQYLGAKDEGQQRAALDALLAYQGKDPQQGGVLVFDAPTGAKDALGNPLTAKTLFDTRRREVIQPGAGIAGDGAALQPPPQDIEYLKANPRMAEKFDAKYGKGAASQVLGK